MSGDKKRSNKWPLAVFIIGAAFLAAGLTMLIIKLVSAPAVADAEFLVSSGKWTREDESAVVWNFAEVGKGSLTTDAGNTNYDFIWAIKDGKLKIETTWLYDLNDEFDYTLDQGAKTLTIKNGETEIKFKAAEE